MASLRSAVIATSDQRHLFETLLGVSGIGPKVALSLLSSAPPDDLRVLIVTDKEGGYRIAASVFDPRKAIPGRGLGGFARRAAKAYRAALCNVFFFSGGDHRSAPLRSTHQPMGCH